MLKTRMAQTSNGGVSVSDGAEGFARVAFFADAFFAAVFLRAVFFAAVFFAAVFFAAFFAGAFFSTAFLAAAFLNAPRPRRTGAASISALHSSCVSDFGSRSFGIFAFFSPSVMYGP